MEIRQTRRTVLKAAASASAVAIGLVPLAGRARGLHTATPAAIDSGGIGISRSDWESIVGGGTPAGNMIEYPNPTRDGFTVLAQFGASDQVTHLEFGFEEAPDGGLPSGDVQAQIDSAMPSDAVMEQSFVITQFNRERTQYRIERYTSESLGKTLGGLATILVAWQETEVGVGTPDGPRVVAMRVTLATVGATTLELREVGNPGGIGLTREEWIARYGEPESSQSGDLFQNEVVPDLRLRVQFDSGDRAGLIDTVALGMMPIVEWSDATRLAASVLPEDASMLEAYLMPPSPQGLAALSCEVWVAPSLAGEGNERGAVLAFYEQAIDTDPVTVARVAVSLPVSPQEATPQA